MKIQLSETELRNYIKKLVKESLEEGALSNSARELSTAAKNFGKESLNKGKQLVSRAMNKIIPTNNDFATQDFLYVLTSKGVDIPDVLSHPELIEDLKKKYPKTWKKISDRYL